MAGGPCGAQRSPLARPLGSHVLPARSCLGGSTSRGARHEPARAQRSSACTCIATAITAASRQHQGSHSQRPPPTTPTHSPRCTQDKRERGMQSSSLTQRRVAGSAPARRAAGSRRALVARATIAARPAAPGASTGASRLRRRKPGPLFWQPPLGFCRHLRLRPLAQARSCCSTMAHCRRSTPRSAT